MVVIIRKFKLKNSLGAEIPLENKDSTTGKYLWFFSFPSGLGFQEMIQTTRIESSYAITDKYFEQPAISGEMAFNSYESYKKFFDSIIDQNLQFLYSPLGNDVWYQRKCIVSNVGKGEFDGAWLRCPIDFLCLTQWRSNNRTKTVTISPDVTGKVYGYTYPYMYSDASQGKIYISNPSATDSPCKLSISTPLKNPHWILSQGGKDIMDGRIIMSINANGELVVNSDPDEMEIALYIGDLRTDYYQHSDFATSRFLYIPPGDSVLFVSHELTDALTITLEVLQNEYAV